VFFTVGVLVNCFYTYFAPWPLKLSNPSEPLLIFAPFGADRNFCVTFGPTQLDGTPFGAGSCLLQTRPLEFGHLEEDFSCVP
jgi:hypothetical protein